MAKKQVIEGIEEGILIQEDFGLEEFQIETLKEREVPIVNEPIETKEKFKSIPSFSGLQHSQRKNSPSPILCPYL